MTCKFCFLTLVVVTFLLKSVGWYYFFFNYLPNSKVQSKELESSWNLSFWCQLRGLRWVNMKCQMSFKRQSTTLLDNFILVMILKVKISRQKMLPLMLSLHRNMSKCKRHKILFNKSFRAQFVVSSSLECIYLAKSIRIIHENQIPWRKERE